MAHIINNDAINRDGSSESNRIKSSSVVSIKIASKSGMVAVVVSSIFVSETTNAVLYHVRHDCRRNGLR